MNLKRKIAASMAVLLLIGSTMNVSAAKLSSSNYVDTLIKNNQESLILNVDAYKAAYPDLAKAFGNDSSAYVNHYLTTGVYEGRTKGVLFDPLIYASAYSDVREAIGYDITAIVDHYLTFGISEKRTQGTAHGYADIAAAEEAGVQSTDVNRNVKDADQTTSKAVNGTSAGKSSNTVNSNSSLSNNNGTANSNSSTTGSNPSNNSNVVADSSVSNSNNTAGSNVSSASTGYSASNSNNSVSSSSNNNSAAAPSSTASASAGSNITTPAKDYDHTTSIYENGNLIRVEYYDENSKLIKYSDVTNYDSNTKSYTENIYHYDESTNTEVLDRTDTYESGSLTSSKNS